MEAIAVIDFETTGLSPAHGSRATEIGVAILENGCIVDRFQSLMNAGVPVPYEIEQLTGISSAMLREAPPASEVMSAVADFVGTRPLVAHNASFDQKFWDAELARIQRSRQQSFACTMLLARRLLPEAPNHKLGTLTRWAGLPATGRAHRALADAEMAAHLLGHIESVLIERHGLTPDPALLCRLQRIPAAKISETLKRERALR